MVMMLFEDSDVSLTVQIQEHNNLQMPGITFCLRLCTTLLNLDADRAI